MKLPNVENAIVAVDTETTAPLSGSALHRDDGGRLFCVSVAHGEKAKTWKFENQYEDNFQLLMNWLSHQRLVMANGKFDLHMFDNWGFDLSDQLFWDVIIATMLLEPREKVGLKETAERAFGIDAKAEKLALDEWFKAQKPRILVKNRRFDQVPWELMEPYATQDARLTLWLQKRQAELFSEYSDPDLDRTFEREMALSKVLFRMEKRGVGFDPNACAKAAVIVSNKRDTLISRIPFDPQINHAKAFFFGPDGTAIPHREHTATGKAKLDKEILARLVAEDVEWAEEYQEIQNLTSALTKWYVTWPKRCGKDGRLRTVFNQTKTADSHGKESGAKSGRLSASRIQLQGIPHDSKLPQGVASLRSFFRAKPGHELWELDLSQAEVRVAAYYSKCKPMVNTLAMGTDIHGSTAKMVFGVDETSGDWAFKRQVGKVINFGTNYGAGVNTVRELITKATGVSVAYQQVEAWLRGYHQTYPQLKRFSAKAQALVEDRGYVKLMGGRKRWFLDHEKSFKAMNSVVQGGVAEVVKEAMIDTELRYPGILLLQIHDSLVLEVPTSAEGQKIVADVRSRMERLFTKRFNRKNRPDLHIDFVVDSKKWEGPSSAMDDDE